jgi:hypothetical protein
VIRTLHCQRRGVKNRGKDSDGYIKLGKSKFAFPYEHKKTDCWDILEISSYLVFYNPFEFKVFLSKNEQIQYTTRILETVSSNPTKTSP